MTSLDGLLSYEHLSVETEQVVKARKSCSC